MGFWANRITGKRTKSWREGDTKVSTTAMTSDCDDGDWGSQTAPGWRLVAGNTKAAFSPTTKVMGRKGTEASMI